jgi:uncharacterized protein
MKPASALPVGSTRTDEDIRRLFAVIDLRDANVTARHFAPNIRLKMGAQPDINGVESARLAFRDVGATYAKVHHEVRAIWRRIDSAGTETIGVQADVTYALANGQATSTPCVSALVFVDGLVSDYQIFIDLTPVAALTRSTNEGHVRDFLKLLEAMDFDAWASLWAEDGVHENPYAPPGFPREFVGRARIKSHWSTFPRLYDGMSFPNLVIHPSSDPAVIVAEFDGDIHMKNSDRKYDNQYCTIFSFDQSGLIKHYREYFNPLRLTDSFSGPGPKMEGLS